jgi:hypothetical protein
VTAQIDVSFRHSFFFFFFNMCSAITLWSYQS